jgi:hypothetical protein
MTWETARYQAISPISCGSCSARRSRSIKAVVISAYHGHCAITGTKIRAGTVLSFPVHAWRAFAADIKKR